MWKLRKYIYDLSQNIYLHAKKNYELYYIGIKLNWKVQIHSKDQKFSIQMILIQNILFEFYISI